MSKEITMVPHDWLNVVCAHYEPLNFKEKLNGAEPPLPKNVTVYFDENGVGQCHRCGTIYHREPRREDR